MCWSHLGRERELGQVWTEKTKEEPQDDNVTTYVVRSRDMHAQLDGLTVFVHRGERMHIILLKS